MREKLTSHVTVNPLAGITPACAGKTTFNETKCRNVLGSPPRVREKHEYAVYAYYDMGSPPRVREKLVHFFELFYFFGITPACAGKTFVYLLSNQLVKDHPRVCGKNV